MRMKNILHNQAFTPNSVFQKPAKAQNSNFTTFLTDVSILYQYHSPPLFFSPNSENLTCKFHLVSTMSSASNCTTRITSQPLSSVSCDGTAALGHEHSASNLSPSSLYSCTWSQLHSGLQTSYCPHLDI